MIWRYKKNKVKHFTTIITVYNWSKKPILYSFRVVNDTIAKYINSSKVNNAKFWKKNIVETKGDSQKSSDNLGLRFFY